MLTKLIVENFKAHKYTEIELGKLTMFTGANNSGKSSLVQALLLLRQSEMVSRLSEGLDLNNILCSIGSGNDALSRFSSEGRIRFGLWDDAYGSLNFEFKVDEQNFDDSFLSKLEYDEGAKDENRIRVSLFNINFQYVSAFREGGNSQFDGDTYLANKLKQVSKNNGKGELVAHFLHLYGAEDVDPAMVAVDTKDNSLLTQTIYWEKKISTGITIEAKKGEESNKYKIVYGIEATTERRGIDNLQASNVGFGVSCSLPIIVALLSAKPGALIIIENPEAHLHPAGQAEIAKLIVLAARNGAQVLVETHSDHILSGVQLACKDYGVNTDTGINPEDVKMHFFSQSHFGYAKSESIKLNSSGILDAQPSGFFDQMEIDVRKLYS